MKKLVLVLAVVVGVLTTMSMSAGVQIKQATEYTHGVFKNAGHVYEQPVDAKYAHQDNVVQVSMIGYAATLNDVEFVESTSSGAHYRGVNLLGDWIDIYEGANKVRFVYKDSPIGDAELTITK